VRKYKITFLTFYFRTQPSVHFSLLELICVVKAIHVFKFSLRRALIKFKTSGKENITHKPAILMCRFVRFLNEHFSAVYRAFDLM